MIFKKQEIKPFVEIFKTKFKAITGLDFEVEEAKEEKKEKQNVKVEELVKEEKQEKKK